MINVLVEHDVTIKPTIETIRGNFPQSSLIIYKGEKLSNFQIQLKTKPMFTEQYIVYFNRVPKEEVLITIKNFNHQYFIRCNKGESEELVLQLKKLNVKDYRIVNNWDIKEEVIEKYVRDNLKGITEKDITYLWKRTGQYIPKLVENVSLLKSFDKVDRKTIQAYVPKRNALGYRDLLQHLMGVKKRKPEQIVQLLGYYSNGHRHMVKYLVEEVEKWKDVWVDMDNFVLTPKNASQYWERNSKKFSRKELLYMTTYYDKITTEFLEILLLQLKILRDDFTESSFIKTILMYN